MFARCADYIANVSTLLMLLFRWLLLVLLHSDLHLLVEFVVELIFKHFEGLIDLFLKCVHA